MRCAAILCVVVAGCGARTGADHDEPPERDAAVPERDTDPGFDTFPCRWSLTQPTTLGRTTATFSRVAGGVHGRRDEAVVSALDGDAPLTVRLALGDPAAVLDTGAIAAEAWLGHESGYISKPDEGCLLERWSSELAPEAPIVDWAGYPRCILEPTDPATLDMTVIAPELFGAVAQYLGGLPRSTLLTLTPGRPFGRSVRHGDEEWTVLWLEDRTLFGRRTTDDVGTTVLVPQQELFATALDRVRTAAVVLRRDPEGDWQLERIPVDGRLELVLLADLVRLPAEPFGTMVTNETEALIPLRDGSVAVAPLDGSAVRFIGPVPEAPVTELVVVMRPGSSGGGLAYVHTGGRTLTFRSLTCNR